MTQGNCPFFVPVLYLSEPVRSSLVPSALFPGQSLYPVSYTHLDVYKRQDKVYYLPSVSYNFRGLTFIRNGLYLGDLKKNRFEPAQPLALAFRKNEAEAVISLSVDDPRLERYLKGETLTIEPEEAAHSKGCLLYTSRCV